MPRQHPIQITVTDDQREWIQRESAGLSESGFVRFVLHKVQVIGLTELEKAYNEKRKV